MKKSWIPCNQSLPSPGEIVETKIHDEKGERNVQELKLGKDGRLWWHSDGTMYVYYTPTHWRRRAEVCYE